MKKFLIILVILFSASPGTAQDFSRGLDLNLGFGYSLPLNNNGSYKSSGRVLNRLGLSYEWPSFKFLFPITINTGLIITTKSVKWNGPDPLDTWTYYQSGFQFSVLTSLINTKFTHLKIGISTVPYWTHEFQLHNETFSVDGVEDVNKLLFDLDLFIRIKIGVFSLRTFYSQSLNELSTSSSLMVSSYGIDFLIPITKSKIIK